MNALFLLVPLLLLGASKRKSVARGPATTMERRKGGVLDAYRGRRRAQEDKIAADYGVSPEELALAREIIPEEAFDATDPVLGANLLAKKLFGKGLG